VEINADRIERKEEREHVNKRRRETRSIGDARKVKKEGERQR